MHPRQEHWGPTYCAKPGGPGQDCGAREIAPRRASSSGEPVIVGCEPTSWAWGGGQGRWARVPSGSWASTLLTGGPLCRPLRARAGAACTWGPCLAPPPWPFSPSCKALESTALPRLPPRGLGPSSQRTEAWRWDQCGVGEGAEFPGVWFRVRVAFSGNVDTVHRGVSRRATRQAGGEGRPQPGAQLGSGMHRTPGRVAGTDPGGQEPLSFALRLGLTRK